MIMSFFSVWNHQKNYLFFSTWVKFWNISRIYFVYFSIQNIKSKCCISFLNFLQSSFSDEKCIPYQLFLFIKGLIFVILCGLFLIFSWFNATVTAYWKHLLSFLLIGFIFFLIQLGGSIYDTPQFGFNLWYL